MRTRSGGRMNRGRPSRRCATTAAGGNVFDRLMFSSPPPRGKTGVNSESGAGRPCFSSGALRIFRDSGRQEPRTCFVPDGVPDFASRTFPAPGAGRGPGIENNAADADDGASVDAAIYGDGDGVGKRDDDAVDAQKGALTGSFPAESGVEHRWPDIARAPYGKGRAGGR
ncbi:hypothetical protein [Streptomyces sp. NPDC093094]|uniref:hypothetical protein n=1 Tax=Streptomyces sp. NPDC093094 TaxID=3366026 RepID=UPI003830CD94